MYPITRLLLRLSFCRRHYRLLVEPRKVSVVFCVVLSLYVCASAQQSSSTRSRQPKPGKPSKPVALFNVSEHKPFGEASPGDPNWRGLTDGVKDSDTAPGCYATNNAPQYPKSLIIDLGGLYPVRQINVTNSLNGNTRSVSIYYGRNRDNWDKGWRHVFPPSTVREFSYSIPERPIRYVRIDFEDTHGGGFGGDNVLYLREVQVWATSPDPLAGNRPVDRSAYCSLSRQLQTNVQLTFGRHVPARVVLLGDSCIEPEGKVIPFPALLEDLLNATFVQKGESPQHVSVVAPLQRGRGIAETLKALRFINQLRDADLLLLSFGPEGQTQGLAKTAELYKRLVAEIGRATDGAILGIVPPFRRTDIGGKQPTADLSEFGAVLRRILTKQGCSVIDMDALAVALGAEIETFDSKGRLSQEGHRLIAEEILAALTRSLPTQQ